MAPTDGHVSPARSGCFGPRRSEGPLASPGALAWWPMLRGKGDTLLAMRRMSLVLVFALIASACGGGDTEPAQGVEPSSASSSAGSPAGSGCAGVAMRSRLAAYEAAQSGAPPAARPPRLGRAIEGVPQGLFTGVVYTGCNAEEIDDLTFEQMAWTNGIGLLLVSWQEWSSGIESGALPLGGEMRQAGVVQEAVTDTEAAERLRVVHLFDGVRVVTVATFSLTTLSIEQVGEMAWAVYDGIPVDMSASVDMGAFRTLDDLLAELPSDQIPVGDAEGLENVSPFTEILGMAVAGYRFTAAGNSVRVYDFGGVGAAERAAASISRDGYTIDHVPYEVDGVPRFWRFDRLLVEYTGHDAVLLARLDELMGPPFTGEGAPGGEEG